MNKIYITPIISFEDIENEALMFDHSVAVVTEHTQDPPGYSEVPVYETPADSAHGGGISIGGIGGND